MGMIESWSSIKPGSQGLTVVCVLAATNTYRPTNLEAEAQDGGAEEAEGTKSKLSSKIVSRSEVYGTWTVKGRGSCTSMRTS